MELIMHSLAGWSMKLFIQTQKKTMYDNSLHNVCGYMNQNFIFIQSFIKSGKLEKVHAWS